MVLEATLVVAEQRSVQAVRAPWQDGDGQLQVVAAASRERVPDGEANPHRSRIVAVEEDVAGVLVGTVVEEDAAAARVEREPATLGVEGWAGHGGADKAGGEGFIHDVLVVEEPQHQGTPALEVKVAEAAAEGAGRDEAGPALADEHSVARGRPAGTGGGPLP